MMSYCHMDSAGSHNNIHNNIHSQCNFLYLKVREHLFLCCLGTQLPQFLSVPGAMHEQHAGVIIL